jgi:hypothetical protein
VLRPLHCRSRMTRLGSKCPGQANVQQSRLTPCNTGGGLYPAALFLVAPAALCVVQQAQEILLVLTMASPNKWKRGYASKQLHHLNLKFVVQTLLTNQ